MATMGFQSLSHKPYVGIGDPFYLDHKKLILHALGQWDEVIYHMTQCKRFPSMWYVRPAKPQISLRIHAV